MYTDQGQEEPRGLKLANESIELQAKTRVSLAVLFRFVQQNDFSFQFLFFSKISLVKFQIKKNFAKKTNHEIHYRGTTTFTDRLGQ